MNRNRKCSKILITFLFLFPNKMLSRAGIPEMLVGIADRGDPDQTASSGSALLSRPFEMAISVQNFKTLIVLSISHSHVMSMYCCFIFRL